MADQSTWDSSASSSGSPPTATTGTSSGEQEEVDNTVSNDYLSFLQQSESARPPSVLPLMGLVTDVEHGVDMKHQRRNTTKKKGRNQR